MRKNAVRRSAYEKFLNEYAAVKYPSDNKDGFKIRYVYYGPWYLWDLPEDRLKQMKRKILILCLLAAAAYIITAALPSVLNGLAAVAYPAIFLLFFVCMESLGACQFLAAGQKTSRSTFFQVDRRLKYYPMLAAGASFISAAGCLYYIIRYGMPLSGLMPLAGYTVSGLLSFFAWKSYYGTGFLTEKNDSLKGVELASLD